MTHYPRPAHSYYAGFHTFAHDVAKAFEVRWIDRETAGTECKPGWYWQQNGRVNWTGPFTSSREAFRDAKDRGPVDDKAQSA